ncbi:antibiotic biosynthesis monooxygenase [Sorangium sp. So ce1024]|uniref:antibiotic biosynthesis monooxygenase n=1 Tax=Sorangium sp. So ce1024 TaxID=3133327 RepID=UPI003F0D86F9
MSRLDSAPSRLARLAVIATLVPACSSGGEEGPTGDAGGGSDTQTAASTFTCADDDMQSPAPFSGPGFQDGALTGAAQDTYLAASTLLWIKADEASQRRFGELATAIVSQLPQQEGIIGFTLGMSEKCGYARTITVWKDEEAMGKFVMSDAHLTAMSEAGEISVHGAATHWTLGASELPPSWEVVRAKIAAVKPSY